MIRVGQYIVNPTIFPDKTSQVWHLPQDALRENSIYWEFESESELIHVCQLADLLKSANCSLVTKVITLTCPYLPYARQHKRISNDSTFSLETFCKTIEQFIDILHTFDVHDESFFEQDGKPNSCCVNSTNFETISKKFNDSEYKIPSLIFWNVNGRPGNNPIKLKDKNVALISGYSPSVIPAILGDTINPMQIMLNTICKERYAVI